MIEDEIDEAGDSGQVNAMAVNTLEAEVKGFIPPNPTSIRISLYNTFVDPTRLYFIAVGRGLKTAAKIQTFIHKSSNNQLTSLCSWWNPQLKQWEYILKGYKPIPLKPPAPTPSVTEEVVMADGVPQYDDSPHPEFNIGEHRDEYAMDEDMDSQKTPSNPVDGTRGVLVDQHALDLTAGIDMVDPASPSSGSNYSQGVRARDKQRNKLREQNEKRGRQVEMNTDEEDVELDNDVLGEGPIHEEDDGADATPRAIVADSDVGESSDDESVHRLAVRVGKRRQVNNGDSNAKTAPEHGGMNSKETEEGIQDLWVTITDKCRAMGKSPAYALKEAGFVISLSRRPNPWNRYRTWLCMRPECPPGM